MSARGVPFQSDNVHLLRRRFGIRTAKIDGVESEFTQCPDGSYSIQGAAALKPGNLPARRKMRKAHRLRFRQ